MNPEFIEKLATYAGYYGAACVAFNTLAAAISAFVKQSPSASDDAAIDKVYASKVYKAVAWIFSWGDYIAELIAKAKTK
ncbi:hypothetical protein OpiT1DRAFT_03840 [Opitutaceae bacterium TAV1]|nr:hypothetical protein OpiT1DRAFT_03840 [Opitutaceae bacterium TAV1]